MARYRRPGFTLVEVLVVIGIISVLMAILVTAVARVRLASEVIVCASNMRQIGLAVANYANDHDGWLGSAVGYNYPTRFMETAAYDAANRPNPYFPYTKRGLQGQSLTFLCPGQERRFLRAFPTYTTWNNSQHYLFLNNFPHSPTLPARERYGPNLGDRGISRFALFQDIVTDDLWRPMHPLISSHEGGGNVARADGSVSWTPINVARAKAEASHADRLWTVFTPTWNQGIHMTYFRVTPNLGRSPADRQGRFH